MTVWSNKSNHQSIPNEIEILGRAAARRTAPKLPRAIRVGPTNGGQKLFGGFIRGSHTRLLYPTPWACTSLCLLLSAAVKGKRRSRRKKVESVYEWRQNFLICECLLIVNLSKRSNFSKNVKYTQISSTRGLGREKRNTHIKSQWRSECNQWTRRRRSC